MTRLVVLSLIVVGLLAHADEWGQIESSLGQKSMEIKSTESELSLLWHDVVVPGGEILLVRSLSTRYQSAFFHHYELAGVINDSIQINASGGYRAPGETSAPTDSSMDQVLYIERWKDDAFYFIPSDLKNKGFFKIESNPDQPGSYLVTLHRLER